jgi:hypothetical protein
MFEKSGRYYADWRDQDGHRLRKSFTSRRAALLFEQEQKELAHPKHKARRSQSPTCSAPTSSAQRQTRPHLITKQQKPSSLKQVRSRRRA